MSRLTTVATFDQAINAQLAKQFLETAGIQTVVSDQEIVAMDWLMSNAVGGIKVQVREEDAERAAAILDKRLGDKSGLVSDEIGEDELTRQALATAPEEEQDDEPAAKDIPPVAEQPGEIPKSDSRDEYARRLLLTAVFSLIFMPLVFYAVYLWLNAAFGEGPLSSRGRRHLWIGAGLTAFWMLTWFLLWQFAIFPSDFEPAKW